MKDLDHPNVLNLFAIARQIKEGGDYNLMMVTPLMPLGVLKDYLEENDDEDESKVSTLVI